MIKTGEWGEFFPASLSPFGYNETVAQEYFPLTREEVLGSHPEFISGSSTFSEDTVDTESSSAGLFRHGPIFNWSDYEAPFPTVEKIIPGSKLPDSIESIPDDILNWAIECEVTKKPFRIIKQELEFYRKHNLPIPRRHPDQRHLDRMALRNPRKLYERICDCENCEENHRQKGVFKEEEFDMNIQTGKRGKKMITTYAPCETKGSMEVPLGCAPCETKGSMEVPLGCAPCETKGSMEVPLGCDPERTEIVYCEECYNREVVG